MQEQQNKRRDTLPSRAPPKHVLFATVLQTDHDSRKGVIEKVIPVRGPGFRADSQNGYQESRPGSYIFTTIPTLEKTPWELERPTKRWSWPVRHSAEKLKRRSPMHLFDKLPTEFYCSVLNHVEGLHATGSKVCADCLLQDVYSLTLVCKIWHRAANNHLYCTLHLQASHSLSRVKPRNRLHLLLRTLRERPDMARRVTRINASNNHGEKLSEQARRSSATDMAAIIKMCPNLHVFSGKYPACYNNEPLDEVNVALASIKAMKEYMWLLEGSRGLLQPASFMFGNWSELETLVIQETGPYLSQGSMYSILRQLPSLQQLALVGLSSFSFHDGTLQALSGLRCLRLEALPGLTDLGLAQALPKIAGTVQNLSLIDLDIKSLRTISHILCDFVELTSFTFVQDRPPGLPLGAEIALASNLPLLRSPNVTYIHWELPVPGSADQALETSIQSNGFPSLRSLQVPCDADGKFQALCRPLARTQLAQQDIRAYEREEAKDYSRDLGHARTAAQLRIRESRRTRGPAISVVVQAEEGDVQFTHVIGGYLGDMKSNIEYVLEPGFEGSNMALGRVDDVICCETFECDNKRKNSKRHVVKQKRELQGLFR